MDDKCPTCGSDNPEIFKLILVRDEDGEHMAACDNPWHSRQGM